LPSTSPAALAVRTPFFRASDARAERVLTIVRLLFAMVALAAIYLDPTEPARYAAFTYALLTSYVAGSAILMAILRSSTQLAPAVPRMIHAADVIVATLLTAYTDGPTSPFFVFFGYTLLAAGYRWGFIETVATGVVCAMLFGAEAVMVSRDGLVEGVFELNRFVIRCAYLILLAVMVGYIAEQEKLARADAAVGASAIERTRIARELHDGVIQSLIGLKMRVEALKPPRGDPGDTLIDETARTLAGEVANLRSIMFELAPIDVAARDLVTLLVDLVDRFERAKGIAAHFDSRVTEGRTSTHLCHEVGRMVQEALVNVHKHSEAREVRVSLSSTREVWNVAVSDDGRGFGFDGRLSDAELLAQRAGPRIIIERVRALGGTLIIESHAGRGARVEISVPRGAAATSFWSVQA